MGTGLTARPLVSLARSHREMDRKRGALAQPTGDGDMSTALGNDAVYRRESEPRAAVGVFRREERLEDSGACLVAHADARIAELEHDVAPRWQNGIRRRDRSDLGISRRDAKRSAFRHRIAGVEREVEQHLLQLTGIRANGPNAGIERSLHPN